MFLNIVEVKVLKSEINKFSIIIVIKPYWAGVLFKLNVDYFKILIKYYFYISILFFAAFAIDDVQFRPFKLLLNSRHVAQWLEYLFNYNNFYTRLYMCII